jgi:acetyltransferase-like isoleucine patch superfamily enzyme
MSSSAPHSTMRTLERAPAGGWPESRLLRVKRALRSAIILIPTRDWVLNHVVCRIPFVSPRMAAYALLGVHLEDRRTGIIMLGSEIYRAKGLHIGRNSAIGRGCVLDARGGIKIGQNVNIGSYSRFQPGKHVIDDPDFKSQRGSIAIGDRAWIAEGAIVVGNVTIGEGAVVAAGAVVTKDVDPYMIVAGVPARPIRERSRDLTYELTWRPNWS